MKASEAREIAETNARKIELSRAAERERNRVASIANEKRKRAEFKAEITRRAAEDIAYAVSTGAKSTRLSFSSSADTPVQAQANFDRHGYMGLIKALLLKLKKDGYKVKTGVASTEHTTQHESSVPDYTYYTYHHYVEVSW